MKDIAIVVQGPKIRLGQIGKAIHREDGKIIDDSDVVEGIVALQKGDDSQFALDGIHKKVDELNNRILPKGVKVVPFLDRSELLHYTTHTVLHNLSPKESFSSSSFFSSSWEVARGAIIVALTMPFASALCRNLS